MGILFKKHRYYIAKAIMLVFGGVCLFAASVCIYSCYIVPRSSLNIDNPVYFIIASMSLASYLVFQGITYKKDEIAEINKMLKTWREKNKISM